MMIGRMLFLIFPRERGCRRTWSRQDAMTLTEDMETLGATENAGVRRVLEVSIASRYALTRTDSD